MKLIALALFFLLCCYGLMAQNLVPNGSFEDTISCPTFPGQVWRAQGWYIVENTPDYFNECCNNIFPTEGVPSNAWGYRYAATGVAYCGFWTYSAYPPPSPNEKIGVKLLTSLNIGTHYYISFKLSSTSSHNQGANGANNKIGTLFSTVKYDLSNLPPSNNYSQFYTDSIITDTTGWSLVKGSFIADSSYDYLSIGNFFDNAHTDTLRYWYINGNRELSAYYFIDDVCVTTDSAGCVFSDGTDEINTPASKTPFLIYPNPVTDVINVQLNSVTANSIMLYNSLGKVVYSQNEAVKNKSYQIDASSFAQGLYLLQINCKEKIITEKISIIH